MRFTIAAFADEADPLLNGQIKALSENAIEYLEIRGVDNTNVSDLSEEKAKEIKKVLDDNGIKVWSIGSPYGKIKIDQPFGEHLEKFKRGIELSHILGSERIRMFSFYVPKNEAEVYREEVFERLYSFEVAAKGSGVILCHENEKGIYGDTADRCADIHENFKSIRAVFDPANFVQCGQDTRNAWEKLGGYVDYMHIKDALPDGKIVPAGAGVGNVSWLLSRYDGRCLTLEPHLSVFKGLEELENGEKTIIDEYRYPSARAAFDAAAQALKKLI